MSDTPDRCPKCSGEMQRGFVLDNSYGARLISHWVPGGPEKSFWNGTKWTDEETHIPIAAFRCASCGFLESYARAEFAPR